MIHKPSQEQLAERFQRIPAELRKAISSATNADALFEIGKKYGLLIDKTGELAAETGLLMLGVTHPDEFVGNLAERLHVDRQTASKIADDINKEIFAPVREHLRGLFDPSTSSGQTATASGEPTLSPLQPQMNQQGISEVRLPEIGLDSRLRGNDKVTPQAETSLKDLEAELEKVITEEKGAAPLHVIKQQPHRDTYKELDPYREQVDEGLPNTRGAPYVPNKDTAVSSTFQAKKEEQTDKIPPGLPFLKGGEKQIPPLEKGVTGDLGLKNGPFQPFRLAPPSRPTLQTKPVFEQSAEDQGIQKNHVSSNTYQRVEKQTAPQPTPTPTPIEDASLFSPTKSAFLGNARGESAANGTLKAFRGFNMNAALPQQSAPAEKEKKDAYGEAKN